MGNGLVLFAVARRYDTPAVGQTVFPDSPVQYKLVTGGLNQWRRSVQFIKEDDALFRIVRSRKKSGRTPLRASVFKTGKPLGDSDGIEQNRTDITQGHAAIRSDFGTTWLCPRRAPREIPVGERKEAYGALKKSEKES